MRSLKDMNADGLLLCKLQAKVFEKSVSQCDTSSAIFIRRFMNSRVAEMIDSGYLLQSVVSPTEIIQLVEEEYRYSNYGSTKYNSEEMYWIGYIYRYFSYTYELSSHRVYKIVKPKELHEIYLPYHTLSPSQAIERILEAKGMLLDEEAELMRQFVIFKQIRNQRF